jgi:hypothetical protein
MHTIIIYSFTFSARFSCLSAAWGALPAGGKPAGGARYAGDRQEKRAETVNKLYWRIELKIPKKQYRK